MEQTKPQHIVGQDHNRAILEECIEHNMPALLVGPAGCAKSSLIAEMAYERGVQLVKFPFNGQTSKEDLLGRVDLEAPEGASITNFLRGPLLWAVERPVWFVGEEINAALSDILFAIHPLLDDTRGVLIPELGMHMVHAHEGFRFFATMNPSAEYAGTKELNGAFLDRFGRILPFDYLSPRDEENLLVDRCDLAHEDAALIARVAQETRKAKAADKVFYNFSTRRAIYWGSAVRKWGLDGSFSVVVLPACADEDRPLLTAIYEAVVGPLKLAFRKTHGKGEDFRSVTDVFEALKKHDEEMEKREQAIRDKEQALRDMALDLQLEVMADLHRRMQAIDPDLAREV